MNRPVSKDELLHSGATIGLVPGRSDCRRFCRFFFFNARHNYPNGQRAWLLYLSNRARGRPAKRFSTDECIWCRPSQLLCEYRRTLDSRVGLFTKHLTIQIHFPKGRPPKSVKCKILEGNTEKLANKSAKILDLFGRRSIVWDVDQPRATDVMKVEWVW